VPSVKNTVILDITFLFAAVCIGFLEVILSAGLSEAGKSRSSLSKGSDAGSTTAGAGFVPSRQDMRDAGAGDADVVGELRLSDVLRTQKLLKPGVHFANNVFTNVRIFFQTTSVNLCKRQEK